MNRKTILHIDMNSYFASVEQQANPFLRGKPVGVCAYLSESGAIIASSIEAKAKGIKTGTRVRDAKILEPNIVLVENEPAKYRSTTEKIFKILSNYTDRFEPYSIDEAFLDLSGWVKNFDEALFAAKKIQKRILEEVGEWLRSSIGISYTKFLAKFAGDIAPKGGILLIDDEEKLNELLRDRDLKDAWGINVKTEEKLNSLGIFNLLDLKIYDENKIRRILGRQGYYLWANVNGLEISEVVQGKVEAKSIGHSYMLKKQSSDKEYLKQIFYKLCEKTGRRLRESDREAGGISIGITYVEYGSVHRSFKTKKRLFTTEEIFEEVDNFIDSLAMIFKVRGLAVSVTRLAPLSGQMNLFEDNLKKINLSKALDKLNDRYGEYTILNGRMFGTEDAARDRIGFRKIL